MHALHARSFVFDGHCDTLAAPLPGPYPRDLTQWGETGHLDLPRLRAGGVNCQIFACFPGEYRLSANPTSAALQRLENLYDLLTRAPDQITLVRTSADLAQLTVDGPIGAILGLEGVEALDGSLALLHTFHRLGVRNVGLAWNGRNPAGDGCEVGSSFGLTPFGRDIVSACNRLGMVIDVSHLNDAGLADVLALSAHPVIASHSNARSLCRHPRNLTDDQLRAIAGNGGVIGATLVAMFIADNPAEASLPRFLDHIDHLVQVAGIDHVGLGSDFDGCTPPPDLNSGEKYPRITDGLLARGYAEEAIVNILGANFRRLFSQVLPSIQNR